MARCHAADLLIVRSDVRRLCLGEVAIDEYVGHAARVDALKKFNGGWRLGGGDEQAVDLTAEKPLHLARFDLAVFLGVADDHVVAEGPDGFRYPLRDFRE